MGIEVTNGGIKIKPLIGEVKLLKNIKSMRIGSGHRSPDILIVEHFGGTTKVWGIDYFDIKEEALIKELEEHCKVKVCWVDGRPMHWENGDCFPD
ncbi:hypothetical protein HY988_04205 [Candidatus Micrarchaeota archaeon]|nr:hypothetical protein [Candidatus Micrarchaeota archaeon]